MYQLQLRQSQNVDGLVQKKQARGDRDGKRRRTKQEKVAMAELQQKMLTGSLPES
jgi:hypothetical protein